MADNIATKLLESLTGSVDDASAATSKWANGLLATDAAITVDRWWRDVSASAASVYDKAMDRVHIEEHLGPFHRLFDGGHDLVNAWQRVREADPNDTLFEEIGAYLTAVYKDVVTPQGLPFASIDRTTFEAAAVWLGLEKGWLADMASFTATEVVGAVSGVLALILNWNKADAEKFAAVAVSLTVSASLGANPLSLIIAIVALARAFHKGDGIEGVKEIAAGATKGVGTAATLTAVSAAVGGPVWIGIVSGICAAVLANMALERGIRTAKEIDWNEVSVWVEKRFGLKLAELRL